jgi:hypothetical protein
MRATLSKALLLAGTAAACGFVSPAGAQQLRASDEAARAVSTVMDYRHTYLDDPLPFDACTVQRALGARMEEIASRLVAHVRGMLDDTETPCPRPFRQGRSIVLVDSVRLSSSTAHVNVTVLRGELIHREAYALDPGSTAVYMGVREVRLWGNSQAYPPRPPRAGR